MEMKTEIIENLKNAFSLLKKYILNINLNSFISFFINLKYLFIKKSNSNQERKKKEISFDYNISWNPLLNWEHYFSNMF
jgi:hypothetical protein